MIYYFLYDIITIMSEKITEKTFEQKNIVNQIVPYKSFNIEYELVLIRGVYYKYQLVDNDQLQKNMLYKVVNNIGNILLLKKL